MAKLGALTLASTSLRFNLFPSFRTIKRVIKDLQPSVIMWTVSHLKKAMGQMRAIFANDDNPALNDLKNLVDDLIAALESDVKAFGSPSPQDISHHQDMSGLLQSALRIPEGSEKGFAGDLLVFSANSHVHHNNDFQTVKANQQRTISYLSASADAAAESGEQAAPQGVSFEGADIEISLRCMGCPGALRQTHFLPHTSRVAHLAGIIGMDSPKDRSNPDAIHIFQKLHLSQWVLCDKTYLIRDLIHPSRRFPCQFAYTYQVQDFTVISVQGLDDSEVYFPIPVGLPFVLPLREAIMGRLRTSKEVEDFTIKGVTDMNEGVRVLEQVLVKKVRPNTHRFHLKTTVKYGPNRRCAAPSTLCTPATGAPTSDSPPRAYYSPAAPAKPSSSYCHTLLRRESV